MSLDVADHPIFGAIPFSTFSVHPERSASGVGDFVIRNSDGDVVSSGRWSPTRLKRFLSFGTTDFGDGIEFGAGNLRMEIEFRGDDGSVRPASIRLICTDFGNPPPGAVQGITVLIPGEGGRIFRGVWPDAPNTAGFVFFLSD